MKLKGSTYFSLTDIFCLSQEFTSEYLIWYKIELKDLCEKLANELVKANLLEMIQTEESEEIQYRWTNQATIDNSVIQNDVSNSKIMYLEEMINIEKYSRDIILDLGFDNGKLDGLGLKRMITILVENNIINQQWLNNESMRLYELSNKIKHGQNFSIDEVEELIKTRIKISFLRQDLFEGYVFSVIDNILSEKGYLLAKNFKTASLEYDIIAKHDMKSDIIFEIKSKTIFSSTEIHRFRNYIEMLKKYNERTNKNNKLIVILFSSFSSKTINSDYIIKKFREQIYSNDIDLSNHIFLLNIREDKFFNKNELTSFLKNLSL